jgi:hypothetical protein
MNQSLIPSLSWYQTKEHVIFTIDLQDINNEEIIFSENNFSFRGYNSNNLYEIKFETFDEIIATESNYLKENKIKVILKKSENSTWTYLTKDKNIYKNNIKVNWSAWIDDDENIEEENQPQFDFQQMMSQMGGNMPDFSNMMGDEEDITNEEECEECNNDNCSYHNEELDDENIEELDDENIEELDIKNNE